MRTIVINRNDRTADIKLIVNETISIIFPLTAKAKNWIKKSVQVSDWQNPDQLIVEHRFIDDILVGIHDAGLSISI